MILVALLGIMWTPAYPRAQQAPSAVIADGPIDKRFPSGLAQFIVLSHGVELDAWLYVASGPGPHGTVILPHPVRGATAAELFAEAERHAKDWDYVQWAEGLRTRPVLLLEADDQNHTDMEALASALRQKSAGALEQVAVATITVSRIAA